MSSPQSSSAFAAFSFDSAELTKSAVNTIRVALGVTGVLALIAGIFITFWPKNSAIVLQPAAWAVPMVSQGVQSLFRTARLERRAADPT